MLAMYMRCSMSVEAAKRGSPSLSSARRHPKLHMSIGKEYLVPKMI